MKKRPTVKKISFAIEAPQANTVMLAGDFNGWQGERTPLRRSKNRSWSKDLTLRPGRYEYKFIVDGNWLLDPSNNNRVWNSFGTENSVIEIE